MGLWNVSTDGAAFARLQADKKPPVFKLTRVRYVMEAAETHAVLTKQAISG
jgi:hypothetical protein